MPTHSGKRGLNRNPARGGSQNLFPSSRSFTLAKHPSRTDCPHVTTTLYHLKGNARQRRIQRRTIIAHAKQRYGARFQSWGLNTTSADPSIGILKIRTLN